MEDNTGRSIRDSTEIAGRGASSGDDRFSGSQKTLQPDVNTATNTDESTATNSVAVLDTRDDTRRGNVLGASADAVAEAHLGASAAADVFPNHSRADSNSSRCSEKVNSTVSGDKGVTYQNCTFVI